MQLVKINGNGSNANAPTTANTTDRIRRILQDGRPSLFLTPHTPSIQKDAAGKVTGWFDLANGRQFIGAGANPPTVTAKDANYSFLDYSETGGEAMVDKAMADILPESGPFTVALVTRTPVSIAAASALFGSLASTDYLYIFVPTGTFRPTFVADWNTPQLAAATAINDNAWHSLIISTGAAANLARIKRDGVNDSSGATGTWALNTGVANYRKVALGGVGPSGATGDGRSDIAAAMVLPFDLDATANAALLGDVQAELAAYVAALNA